MPATGAFFSSSVNMCLHHLHMLYLPSPLATIETVARSISKVLLFQSRLFQAVLRTRVNDHLARFGLVLALVTANFRLTFPQEGAPGVTSTEEGDTHAFEAAGFQQRKCRPLTKR